MIPSTSSIASTPTFSIDTDNVELCPYSIDPDITSKFSYVKYAPSGEITLTVVS